MTRSAHTTPPADAAARRRAPSVLAYSVDQVPPFDAAFYDRARTGLTKTSELIVAPREAATFTVPARHLTKGINVLELEDLMPRTFGVQLHVSSLDLAPACAAP